MSYNKMALYRCVKCQAPAYGKMGTKVIDHRYVMEPYCLNHYRQQKRIWDNELKKDHYLQDGIWIKNQQQTLDI